MKDSGDKEIIEEKGSQKKQEKEKLQRNKSIKKDMVEAVMSNT